MRNHRIIITIFFVAVLLLAGTNIGIIAQEGGKVTSTRDLGWITYATSNNTVEYSINVNSPEAGFSGDIYIYNNWNFDINCGVSLPINLTVMYPDTITPGENISIGIAVESLPGYIFFYTSGDHELNVSLNFDVDTSSINFTQPLKMLVDMVLALENHYYTQFQMNMFTPIGEVNETYEGQIAHSGSMSLDLYMDIAMTSPANINITKSLSVDSGISVNIKFNVTLVAKTKIIGYVYASGSALTEPINTTVEWISEGIKNIALPIRPDASPDDTVELNIDVEYVVEEFYIEFSDIILDVDLDEERIAGSVGNEFREWSQMVSAMIQQIISNFQGTTEFVISQVGETVPMPQPPGGFGVKSAGTGDNNLRSEAPYDEVSLLSKSIYIGQAPSNYAIYVGIAAIVGIIVVAYIWIRKNRKS